MLRPDYPKEGVDKHEFFKQKFGGAHGAQQFFSNVVAAAKEEGLHYAPLEGLKTGNSSDAHRLVIWSRGLGKEEELLTEIYRIYNCDGKWVGDHDVLLDAVDRAGLNRADAVAVLGDQSICAQDLEQSLSRSRQLGVNGVPAFFVNGRHVGSGAQPTEAFLRIFKNLSSSS